MPLREPDDELLQTAQRLNRIFVTLDRDFGALVFVRRISSTGVLYLRILPSTQNSVHQELARVLATYSEMQIAGTYIVIEADGHRVRKLPSQQ